MEAHDDQITLITIVKVASTISAKGFERSFPRESIAQSSATSARLRAMSCNEIAYCAFEPSRRSERESASRWREKDSGGKNEVKENETYERREDERHNGRQADALEGRKDREAHLSFCTSAVRHPGDRSTLSVRRRSPLARLPRGIALIYVDTIFIRTDRWVGRSLIRAAHFGPPAYFGTAFPFPSFSPATTTD